MDLSRGICILCTNNTKVVIPPQAEDITFLIKDILVDEIDVEKFDKYNHLLKICPFCLHDIKATYNQKQNVRSNFSKFHEKCSLCEANQHLVIISEWNYFNTLLDNITFEKRFGKLAVCLDCVKYLELLAKIKKNLLKKYPELALSDSVKRRQKYHFELSKKSPLKTVQISNDEDVLQEESENSYLNNPQVSLQHLKPLNQTDFDMDEFKEDEKLLSQIAFVKLYLYDLNNKQNKRFKRSGKVKKYNNLHDSEFSRDSPKLKHSFFKIKLKNPPNKLRLQKVVPHKIIKPNNHKKFVTTMDKELIIRLSKMDFKKHSSLSNEQTDQQTIRYRTPTKASQKMMIDEPISSSKKKNVTFAEILNVEIKDGESKKDNIEGTPLKSSLKKRSSPCYYANETVSETDASLAAQRSSEKDSSDSEVEGKGKGFVADIIQHNDEIFESLKILHGYQDVSESSQNNSLSCVDEKSGTELVEDEKEENCDESNATKDVSVLNRVSDKIINEDNKNNYKSNEQEDSTEEDNINSHNDVTSVSTCDGINNENDQNDNFNQENDDTRSLNPNERDFEKNNLISVENGTKITAIVQTINDDQNNFREKENHGQEDPNMVLDLSNDQNKEEQSSATSERKTSTSSSENDSGDKETSLNLNESSSSDNDDSELENKETDDNELNDTSEVLRKEESEKRPRSDEEDSDKDNEEHVNKKPKLSEDYNQTDQLQNNSEDTNQVDKQDNIPETPQDDEDEVDNITLNDSSKVNICITTVSDECKEEASEETHKTGEIQTLNTVKSADAIDN